LLLRLTVWSQVPLAVCLSLLAAPAVSFLYGQRWVGVSNLLPFASAFELVHGVQTVFLPLLITAGATRDRWICDAISLATAILALGGLAVDLSAYILASTAALAVPTLYGSYAARREGWIDAKGTRQAVVPALTAGALAMLTAWPIWQRTNGTIGAIISVMVFISVYILALRVLFSPRLEELVSALPKSGLLRRVFLLAPNADVAVQG
jgi:O-antigen/teichoic acid export membrane protein